MAGAVAVLLWSRSACWRRFATGFDREQPVTPGEERELRGLLQWQVVALCRRVVESMRSNSFWFGSMEKRLVVGV